MLSNEIDYNIDNILIIVVFVRYIFEFMLNGLMFIDKI